MKRTEFLKLRLSKAEKRQIRAGAKKNGISESDYARKRILGTPLKARKPKYKTPEPEDAEDSQFLHMSVAELQEYDREFNAAVARAEKLIKEYGKGVQAWVDSLSSEELEELDGLEDHLLEMENYRKQQAVNEARWAADREREERERTDVLPSVPNQSPGVDREAQRGAALRKAIEEDQKRTAYLTGIIL